MSVYLFRVRKKINKITAVTGAYSSPTEINNLRLSAY